jgi:hypothetical protein
MIEPELKMLAAWLPSQALLLLVSSQLVAPCGMTFWTL